jgi:hypothetical protein
MDFNPLIDSLPREFGGYSLNTSFRQPIKLFALLRDDELSDDEKSILSVAMFFGNFDQRDMQDLAEFISWYVNAGEEAEPDDGHERTFDMLEDSQRIHAAFLQVYGINLMTSDMHWWTFLSLLNCLPTGTKLAEVIDIRSRPIPRMDKHNREYVSSISRLKEMYRIGKAKNIGAKLQDIWEAL